MAKISQFHPHKNYGLLKAAVFGANDGIITTFAVVAAVAGAGLSPKVVLIMGIGNLVADGFSMGVGDYIGERTERAAEELRTSRKQLRRIWLTGIISFLAFVVAGALPLVPYVLEFVGLSMIRQHQLLASAVATGVALFLVGSLRTIFTKGNWWRNGVEVLLIGAVGAGVAYLIGAVVEVLIR